MCKKGRINEALVRYGLHQLHLHLLEPNLELLLLLLLLPRLGFFELSLVLLSCLHGLSGLETPEGFHCRRLLVRKRLRIHCRTAELLLLLQRRDDPREIKVERHIGIGDGGSTRCRVAREMRVVDQTGRHCPLRRIVELNTSS